MTSDLLRALEKKLEGDIVVHSANEWFIKAIQQESVNILI